MTTLAFRTLLPLLLAAPLAHAAENGPPVLQLRALDAAACREWTFTEDAPAALPTPVTAAAKQITARGERVLYGVDTRAATAAREVALCVPRFEAEGYAEVRCAGAAGAPLVGMLFRPKAARKTNRQPLQALPCTEGCGASAPVLYDEGDESYGNNPALKQALAAFRKQCAKAPR